MPAAHIRVEMKLTLATTHPGEYKNGLERDFAHIRQPSSKHGYSGRHVTSDANVQQSIGFSGVLGISPPNSLAVSTSLSGRASRVVIGYVFCVQSIMHRLVNLPFTELCPLVAIWPNVYKKQYCDRYVPRPRYRAGV